MQFGLSKDMDADIDFSQTADDGGVWSDKVSAQIFAFFFKTVGCAGTKAVISQTWPGMERGKRIRRIAGAGINILADWQKGEQLVAAKKVDMGIAKYDNSIILIVV